MSFNVYRTTKGKVGEPVYAEIQATNPHTGAEYVNIFPIKEYYTNRQVIRPDILAGSFGDLRIEVRCISPTQYLGMAESDLYLLSSSGNFGVNYMKGLFGIWLQAMVLTAIGVFAGTFLSWPVALLTTIAFFVAGQLAFGFLVDFTRQAILGGGPFESLIRLLTHDNQMSDLAPTAGVVIAKTLDSLVMPVMSMLVYVVPNFQALDVSNTVADGFAVSWARSWPIPCWPWPMPCRSRSSHTSFSRTVRSPHEKQSDQEDHLRPRSSSCSSARCSPTARGLPRRRSGSDLGEAAIGQIDTGSFMMKLFLLGGFRGIVANYLWLKAEENKRDHDWDRLKSNVDLITKLQPHFLSIWTFQGWNLAYNVSVEWDAPEDKYEWIKQGIKFVQQGVDHNRRSPDLIWDTAWFYYHKLGFADESIILRRLFRDDEDEDFKTYRDPETGINVVKQDNFQLGYGWFSQVGQPGRRRSHAGQPRARRRTSRIQYVDPTPQRKGRPDDIAFRCMPAHAQTHYAAALEKMSTVGIEATFGEVAKNEWARALREWVKFGKHDFESPNVIKRNGKFVRDTIRIDDRTEPEEYKKLNENQKYWTDRWASQMNYPYWKERCKAEMTQKGVEARQLFYEGTKAYKTGDFAQAAAKFKEGLAIWKDVLKDFPVYRSRRSQQEGHRADRQALRASAPAAAREGS